MVKSMTGYGRSEKITSDYKCTVEIKSVNHRYLDLSIKLPRKLNVFEGDIREVLRDYIQRGKVDVYITYEDYCKEGVNIKYNSALAGEYINYLREMSEEFDIDDDVRVSTISRMPEVLVLEDEAFDENETWKNVKECLQEACDAFVVSRIKEGENLKNDLIMKLDDMLTHVAYIKERAPEIIAEYKKGLEDKVKELLGDVKVDEARLLTEVTIFADKVCIDEEILRLLSHIETTKKALIEGGSIGRKLDFIAQEMNREANTILSKANDLATSNHAIELKTEIEKVREQIQNIE